MVSRGLQIPINNLPTKLNGQEYLSMVQAIKAVRATILLGEIELDVFQMPDGSYKFQTQKGQNCDIKIRKLSYLPLYLVDGSEWFFYPEVADNCYRRTCEGEFSAFQNKPVVVDYHFSDDFDFDVVGYDNITESDYEVIRYSVNPTIEGIFNWLDYTDYLGIPENQVLSLHRMLAEAQTGGLTGIISAQFLLSDAMLPLKKGDDLENKHIIKRNTPQRGNKKKPKGYIYVCVLDGCIKVGFSTNVQRRLKSYRTSNTKVELLFTREGTLLEERLFHKKYNGGLEKYELGRETKVIELLKNFVV